MVGVVCLKVIGFKMNQVTRNFSNDLDHLSNKTKVFIIASLQAINKTLHAVEQFQEIYFWGQTKHFSVSVSRNRRHPFNFLKIELFDADSQKSIGSTGFNLHDIISVTPIAGLYDVWDQHQLVGELEIEITFNYGTFGSQQIKEEKSSSDAKAIYSLLPRILPSVDQTMDGIIPSVVPVPHPTYIPFHSKVFLSFGKDVSKFWIIKKMINLKNID